MIAFIYAETIRAHALDELKETSYAAIYAFVAVAALLEGPKRARVTHPNGVVLSSLCSRKLTTLDHVVFERGSKRPHAG